MSRTEQGYRDAAKALPKNFLGGSFGESETDELAVNAVHKLALFKENAELLGLQGGSVESVQRRGKALAKHSDEVRKRESEKAKSSGDDIVFLDLLDNQIRWLDGQIGDREREFAAEFGEEWREVLALKILDEDAIPERREGESMAEYRERLEQALIDEMLDENGNIKPEYKDHPEYGRYAEWAQWKYDRREAKTLKAEVSEPGLSDAEKLEKIDNYKETASYGRILEARPEFEEGSAERQALKEGADRKADEEITKVSAASGDDAFLSQSL